MPYKNLTDEQMDAVVYNDNMLLSACPGSGKTRTLVSKLCHIIDNSEELLIGKRKVVAITYTNIAANTIQERLLSYGVESKSLWVGTIHALCLQWIIMPNINIISRLCGGFIIIDEHEKETKISELKENYGFKSYNHIDTALNLDNIPQYSAETKEYKLTIDYHRYLAENNYIDFDLILNISHRLLQSNPKLCKRLGNLFYHILVDEYQDTSVMQYEILKCIIKQKQTKITLIGDREQAIYTGLGAIVKSKSELESFFELDFSLQEKRLTGCFRSSQKIINHYPKYQDEGYGIDSKSNLRNYPSVVHLERSLHKDNLADYVADIVKQHLTEGIPEKEIAILCPSWFDVINMSKNISTLNKGFNIDGVLISPIPKNQDNFWLILIRLVLTKPSIHNYIKRKWYANELSEKLTDISFDEEVINPKTILRTVNSLNVQFDKEIDEWIEEIIVSFCKRLRIELTENDLFHEGMKSILNATRARMTKYKMDYKASELEKFFSSSSGVKITTAHSTKGDEYEVVICTGLLEGKIPHWNDIMGCGDTHQDYVARRLLYVISSRAKKHLYLISELGYRTTKGAPYRPTRQL
ncbi:ATP-dependent helicase [Acinetobacter sp. V91_7]|uniref:ATP-dependent helicase n=1 Tax=unclassified Acinetobacter TaxID=196816 RepID=UPI00287EC3C2|nr:MULTISPECIES: ATP-dependent helicase [unclassified Acinetobacter]MDS7930085.1 ATP-dependent helicase [Acinetobacter sp. V102_4]MDS7933535.1 ATP-dependent helicase [Acinetobacter sp. V91_4B]MDS7965139.1 ATP-dependent helicase [Acinetobacter sp. V91_7]MDS8027654.1 ATP-dependent helicase [Acinetobacter sp. V91_13]